jgi:hypothetical protein
VAWHSADVTLVRTQHDVDGVKTLLWSPLAPIAAAAAISLGRSRPRSSRRLTSESARPHRPDQAVRRGLVTRRQPTGTPQALDVSQPRRVVRHRWRCNGHPSMDHRSTCPTDLPAERDMCGCIRYRSPVTAVTGLRHSGWRRSSQRRSGKTRPVNATSMPPGRVMWRSDLHVLNPATCECVIRCPEKRAALPWRHECGWGQASALALRDSYSSCVTAPESSSALALAICSAGPGDVPATC